MPSSPDILRLNESWKDFMDKSRNGQTGVVHASTRNGRIVSLPFCIRKIGRIECSVVICDALGVKRREIDFPRGITKRPTFLAKPDEKGEVTLLPVNNDWS